MKSRYPDVILASNSAFLSRLSFGLLLMSPCLVEGQNANIRQEQTRNTFSGFYQAAPSAISQPGVTPRTSLTGEIQTELTQRLRAAERSARQVGANFASSGRQANTQQAFSEFFKANAELFNSVTASNTIQVDYTQTTLPQRLSMYQEKGMQTPLHAEDYLMDDLILELKGNPNLTPIQREILQIVLWNKVSLAMTALDHTSVPAGVPAEYAPFENVGPVRTSRVLAMVHWGAFEAVNAFEANPDAGPNPARFKTFRAVRDKLANVLATPPPYKRDQASVELAVAHTSYLLLSKLYPSKANYLFTIYSDVLSTIDAAPSQLTAARLIADAIAREILYQRNFDGSDLPDPGAETFETLDPGKWHPDPLNPELAGVALGANWFRVKPFVLTQQDIEKYRPKPPPAVNSDDYERDYKDVFERGGQLDADPNIAPIGLRKPTSTIRSPDEEFVGKFWAYDGTAYLCAPPRLYNMVATSICYRERKDDGIIADPAKLTRYLALINVALADAGVGAWEAKYFYLYPRPVTGIRSATAATHTFPGFIQNDKWTPLGAPVSNAPRDRVNLSPPFPAYPSGHAVFGGALFEVLRQVYNVTPRPKPMEAPGPQNTEVGGFKFRFVSDEYNGLNRDAGATAARPYRPADFDSLGFAEWDNARSRIFLGIHWQFDAINGIAQGVEIGKHVVSQAFMLE